ncbi:MAG: hypothetical protein A2942_04185 [Candidatus Lloydbacteria bacterium RIFCSPLOWO2_01_FULL_50_20]|uniref:Uncharacterized protein n=1 Tax=Candidatus Lloydbacteria bacterium RIFCSPLOWO2_01_FULL_50_20 TaxID=1798665 RepID=A0A1G2DD57_9BACT|nr:MAG: hypothetical protein A3C13_00290 [Candidatus Lloydbacteria bacterium RIFCSPHIGHO2_02_FULL_50_11]OGZ11382.1 MAG: hypothetical protein A2942_04185 [Candidatus Lloydbacteria bacterium RIFCSPLOWO2_01_FULL_50_20]
MSKEKDLTADNDDVSSGNETGDTVMSDIDSIRFQLRDQLAKARAEKVPNLALVEVIKNIQNTLNGLDRYAQTTDPDYQEKIRARIDELMESTREPVDLSNKLQIDKHIRDDHGVNLPANPDKTNVVVPHDWEDRPQ